MLTHLIFDDADILYAEAKSSSDGTTPLAIKCDWFRVLPAKDGQQQKMQAIPHISTNVYQLSVEDVGCHIQVQARPLVASSTSSSASGIATGQFGPIELEPQCKQAVEQALGSGHGSQFPIQHMLPSSS